MILPVLDNDRPSILAMAVDLDRLIEWVVGVLGQAGVEGAFKSLFLIHLEAN